MPRKGYKRKKSYEELFGVVKAKKVRKKLSKAQLKRKERDGYINSPQTRKKLKEISIKDYKENPEKREQRRKSALEQFKDGMPRNTKRKIGLVNSISLKGNVNGFKKGGIPWNKNKRGLQVAWNKNKPNYEIRGDKNPAKRLEVRKKIGLAVTGEKNGQWQDGKSFEPYTKEFNNRFKRSVRKRDNQICMLCGIHREKSSKTLCVHHINYDKELSVPQNCLCLCNSCHTKTNSNRKYWISFFQSLLSEKYGYEYSKDQEIIIKQPNERFK